MLKVKVKMDPIYFTFLITSLWTAIYNRNPKSSLLGKQVLFCILNWSSILMWEIKPPLFALIPPYIIWHFALLLLDLHPSLMFPNSPILPLYSWRVVRYPPAVLPSCITVFSCVSEKWSRLFPLLKECCPNNDSLICLDLSNSVSAHRDSHQYQIILNNTKHQKIYRASISVLSCFNLLFQFKCVSNPILPSISVL